jgi:hypothetical protein
MGSARGTGGSDCGPPSDLRPERVPGYRIYEIWQGNTIRLPRRQNERAVSTLVKSTSGSRMKVVHVVLPMAIPLACCGGHIIVEESGDASSSAHGGSSGAGGTPGTGEGFADASPEPSDGACNAPLEPAPCASCPDGQWHCGGGGVFPQCPSAAEPGGSCTALDGGAFTCAACMSEGTGYELTCFELPKGHWEVITAVSCSP